jgi:hypothetical protein
VTDDDDDDDELINLGLHGGNIPYFIVSYDTM